MTGLILLKFTGYDERTHKALYINFQSNLKFYKNIKILSFTGYRWLLWSNICLENPKRIELFAYFPWKQVDFISKNWLKLHENVL